MFFFPSNFVYFFREDVFLVWQKTGPVNALMTLGFINTPISIVLLRSRTPVLSLIVKVDEAEYCLLN